MVGFVIDTYYTTNKTYTYTTITSYWISCDIVFVLVHVGRLSSASGEEEPDTSHEWD